MGKDFTTMRIDCLSKPPPSARSGRTYPRGKIEAREKENKGIDAKIKRNEYNELEVVYHRKLIQEQKSKWQGNLKGNRLRFVRFWNLRLSHTHTHKQTACRGNGVYVKYKVNKNNCKYRFNDGTENEYVTENEKEET